MRCPGAGTDPNPAIRLDGSRAAPKTPMAESATPPHETHRRQEDGFPGARASSPQRTAGPQSFMRSGSPRTRENCSSYSCCHGKPGNAVASRPAACTDYGLRTNPTRGLRHGRGARVSGGMTRPPLVPEPLSPALELPQLRFELRHLRLGGLARPGLHPPGLRLAPRPGLRRLVRRPASRTTIPCRRDPPSPASYDCRVPSQRSKVRNAPVQRCPSENQEFKNLRAQSPDHWRKRHEQAGMSSTGRYLSSDEVSRRPSWHRGDDFGAASVDRVLDSDNAGWRGIHGFGCRQ